MHIEMHIKMHIFCDQCCQFSLFQVDRKHSGLTLRCSAHNGAETAQQLEAAKARVTLDVR